MSWYCSECDGAGTLLSAGVATKVKVQGTLLSADIDRNVKVQQHYCQLVLLQK